MKTTSASLQQLLLAGLLAVPLLAMHGAARATDADGERPPLLQGGAGHLPGGPQGGPQGGPPHGQRSETAAPHGDTGRGHGPERGQRDGLPPFGEPGLGAMPPFLHGVDLSIAQQDKAFAILHAQAPYLYEQGKAAKQAHDALRSLARADQYDDAKAVALSKDAANAMANLALQRVRTEQKLLAILTPEQRKKLATQALPPQSRP